VGERIAPRIAGGLGHQAGVQRVLERGQEPVLVKPQHTLEQPGVEVEPDDRGDAAAFDRAPGQALGAKADHVADVVGQPHPLEVAGARLLGADPRLTGGGHLSDDQRDALCLVIVGLRELKRGRPAHPQAHELHRLGLAQAADVELHHQFLAAQSGQCGAEALTPAVHVAVGAHDRHARVVG
jgi:hypothetical protein